MSDDTPPETPEAMRHRATSSADWVEAVTGTHSLTSAPPGALRVYAKVGYYLIWLMRETWIHRTLILHWIALSVGATAATHHWLHWLK